LSTWSAEAKEHFLLKQYVVFTSYLQTTNKQTKDNTVLFVVVDAGPKGIIAHFGLPRQRLPTP
jgi:hypothetical protein